MLLRAIAHQKAGLHGVELIPGLDLHRGQRHRCAMTNTVESDLLDTGQDIVEACIDKGALSINGIHGRVCR